MTKFFENYQYLTLVIFETNSIKNYVTISKKIMGLKNIRRCQNCNHKTHQNLWTYGKICPVCDEPAPFKESFHGGLSAQEISDARKEIGIKPRDWGVGGIER